MNQDNKERAITDKKALHCHAFLIRCWRERDEWRFIVETVSQEREQHGFANLEALLAFMQTQLMSENKQ
ncbi:MAG: hypothetical protein GY943_17790 [Chloroflexi bacterium]|nr:hypothetical protein [Chloroflexota bacterium]